MSWWRSAEAAPPHPMPDEVAGISAEVQFLRSRGFVVFAAGKDLPGFWKVDGALRSAAWIREKADAVRRRPLSLAPPPVVVAKVAAPVSEPEATVPAPEAGEPTPPDRFRGLGAEGVREALVALREPAGGGTALAKLLGVPVGSIHAVLCGKVRPTAEMIQLLYGPEGAELLPRWIELLAGGPIEIPQPPPGPSPLDPAPAAEREAGPGVDGPASDSLPEAAPTRPASPVPTFGAAPWSLLEDYDFVAIARGKLAGVQREIEDVVRAYADLHARMAELQGKSIDLEVRERALTEAIAAFTPDEGAGTGSEDEESDDGDPQKPGVPAGPEVLERARTWMPPELTFGGAK